MKKLSFFFLLALVFTSCTENSDELAPQNTTSISGYKITSTRNFTDPSLPEFKNINTGTLVNGKLHSEMIETYTNNVLTNTPVSAQKYFYTNDVLTKVEFSTIIDEYFYDAQNRLIGAKRNHLLYGVALNYRFIHQNNTTVICESIDLPYDNPAAVAIQRMILNFDANDNVISAGYDNDFDGTISNLYAYNYIADNLVSMQRPNGTIENYSYATIIDSYQQLRELSYGKKVLRLICSESYCGGNVTSLDYSKNITTDDSVNEVFNVLPSNNYSKRTKITSVFSSSGTIVDEIEVFFN